VNYWPGGLLGRSSLNALAFLKKAFRMCANKSLVGEKSPWYPRALEKLELDYRHERFFKYLNGRQWYSTIR
jgi:transposase-like protein